MGFPGFSYAARVIAGSSGFGVSEGSALNLLFGSEARSVECG
jgi:hypothetical protein